MKIPGKILFMAGLACLSATAAAQNGNNNQGSNNGQPFQQLQEAIDAASEASQSAIDANAAAISANESAIQVNEAAIQVNADAAAANASAISANEAAIQVNETAIKVNSDATAANEAAITAEQAAREAGDAAVAAEAAADLANEVAARIAGDENLQDAADANAYAISANTSAIDANSSAIAAEEAARMSADSAQDAAVSAAIAAEAAARITGDNQLQANINALEADYLADLDLLGMRVSTLEGFHQESTDGLDYEETAAWDINDLAGDLASLNYQPGEWFYMGGTYLPANYSIGFCSANTNIYTSLMATIGGYYSSPHLTDPNGFFYHNGNWQQSVYLGIHAQPGVFNVHGSGVQSYSLAVFDRQELNQTTSQNYEVLVNNYALGNTLTIQTGATRMEACGF